MATKAFDMSNASSTDMAMKRHFRSSLFGWALASSALLDCSGDDTAAPPQKMAQGDPFADSLSPGARDTFALRDQRIDYSLALRSAAIKLIGDLPPLAAIEQVQNVPDQAAAYAAIIDKYLADPAFTAQMITFWQRTLLRHAVRRADQVVRSLRVHPAPSYLSHLNSHFDVSAADWQVADARGEIARCLAARVGIKVVT